MLGGSQDGKSTQHFEVPLKFEDIVSLGYEHDQRCSALHG